MMLMTTLLLGCGDAPEDNEALLASDVETTARVLDEVAAQTTQEACLDGPGSCAFCYTAVGTPVGGTFEAGVSDLPCTTTLTGGAGGEYTFEASSYTGSWETTTDGMSVSMSGTRTATLDGAGGRLSTASTIDLTEASLTLDANGAVTAFGFEGTYVGTTGRTLTLQIEEVDGQLEGSAMGANGSCTIGGTRYAPVVDCER